MAFAERIRHFLHRGGGSESHTSGPAPDGFIASRRANLRHVKTSQIEEMTDAALARVDRDKTLREAQALRERWKVQSEQSARDPSE
jgi:hypothetical protein